MVSAWRSPILCLSNRHFIRVLHRSEALIYYII
jgi:hypothetical protein